MIDHLKTRLPAPIAAQLDGIVKSGSGSGQAASSSGIGGLAGELGGLFGKK